MKFIHTADWHIGQDFYHYDRSEEHRCFFSQLAELVKREQPDVLLVCGDVFHTATPSNASMRLYTEGMMQLHAACPEMRMVVIAGNHDSSSRLAAAEALWKLAKVHVVGALQWDGDGNPCWERHIIEIPHKAYLIAVPYIHERYHALFAEFQRRVAERNSEQLPVLMTGHLAVRSSDLTLTGHDPAIVGGLETMPLSDYGDGYDYWALGHIHFPQTLKASGGRVRYSGSPIPVSFDEQYPHTVSVVSLEKHGALPLVKEVPIRSLCHLRTIPSRALPLEEVLRLLQAEVDSAEADSTAASVRDAPQDLAVASTYVRVRVRVKDYLGREASERILEILNRQPRFRFCLIQAEPEAATASFQPPVFDTRRIQDTHPLEVAKACYRFKFGKELETRQVKMLEEVIASLHPKEEPAL